MQGFFRLRKQTFLPYMYLLLHQRWWPQLRPSHALKGQPRAHRGHAWLLHQQCSLAKEVCAEEVVDFVLAAPRC